MSRTYKDKPHKLRERKYWHETSGHNKHLTIGVGGMNCICCFPAPNSKERKLEFRRAKKLEAKLHMQCENEAY